MLSFFLIGLVASRSFESLVIRVFSFSDVRDTETPQETPQRCVWVDHHLKDLNYPPWYTTSPGSGENEKIPPGVVDLPPGRLVLEK